MRNSSFLSHNLSNPVIENDVLDKPISLEEIVAKPRKGEEVKAPGRDGINYSFFKNLLQNWLLFIQVFLNSIWNTEITPKSWGNFVMTMLHEKDDPEIASNYRPITLTNCISKIFMQILNTRLESWVAKNNLLPEHQCGFRKG